MFLVAFRLYDLPMRRRRSRPGSSWFPSLYHIHYAARPDHRELFERPESSTVALALPTTFGIRGFVQVAEMGAQLGEAWRAWGALWLQVLVYGAGAGVTR
jgi:hypothetical protein